MLESGWGVSRGGCESFQLDNQENAISQARKDGGGTNEIVPITLRVRNFYGVYVGTVRGHWPCESGM